MSGGSYDYAYAKARDMGERLSHSEDPLRVAFGKHLLEVAHAMHAIEWVDSGDWSNGDDVELIRACIPADAELGAAIEMAEKARVMLEAVIERAKA